VIDDVDDVGTVNQEKNEAPYESIGTSLGQPDEEKKEHEVDDASAPDDDAREIVVEPSPGHSEIHTNHGGGLAYIGGLDGLRALAVGSVIAFHFSLSWARGGYLGVDLFFVLSGYLITTLLIGEHATNGKIRLAAFWARRARRLLPALFLMLFGVALFVLFWSRFGPPGAAATFNFGQIRSDALATLGYVANWHAIFSHQTYFGQFQSPSPLIHTWSLAIEEQFYLLWPLILLLLYRLVKVRRLLVGACVGVIGAGLSLGWMSYLYYHHASITRVYFGTDSHAFGLLGGVALGFLLAKRRTLSTLLRFALHVLAVISLLGLLYLMWKEGTAAGYPSSFMFRGGYVAATLAAAIVIADVATSHGRGILGRLFSVPPLRWIGKISYGLYLYHVPVIVFVTTTTIGLKGWQLSIARLSITIGSAVVSFFLIEQPIRRSHIVGWPRFVLAPVLVVLCGVVLVVATDTAVAVPPHKTHVIVVPAFHPVPLVESGTGGYNHETPVALAPFSSADPLRITIIGDSVANIASLGITASLESTGAVHVDDAAFDGFGLTRKLSTTPSVTSIDVTDEHLANADTQVVVGTWGWDSNCTPKTPTVHFATYTCALQHPKAYKTLLENDLTAMLAVHSVEAVVLLEYPIPGADLGFGETTTAPRVLTARKGIDAWNKIAREMPKRFPGKVLYLPIARAVLLHGTTYSPWLPTPFVEHQSKSTWVRVRMVDGVHFCQSGDYRYANALLVDLTSLFRLPAATPLWINGAWNTSTVFTDPPGTCPSDHP
jgi:peptidoglycan/LPS O-acetylase OafA/YrhL